MTKTLGNRCSVHLSYGAERQTGTDAAENTASGPKHVPMADASGNPVSAPTLCPCNLDVRAALPRFLAKVSPEPMSGCWLWTGATQTNGYGSIGFGSSGRTMLAHRFSYVAHRGPVPDGLTLDHLCRVRLCVNPDHLEAVTGAENNRRGESPTAQNIRKTHCQQGHPLSGPNLYVKPSTGKRQCRECLRAAQRAWYARNLAGPAANDNAEKAMGGGR